MKTEIIRNLYMSLLADVSRELEVDTMSPPNSVDLVAWCIKDAPVLDKQLVRCLGDLPASDFWAHYRAPWNLETADQWPGWLRPLLDKLDHDAVAHTGDFVKGIRHLRTLLGFCYKIEHAPAKTQIEEAQKVFLETEEGIRIWDSTFNAGNPGPYLRYARKLIQRVLNKGTRSELLNCVTPSHGPGAVYPSCEPRMKSQFTTVYPSIERFYPFDRWMWQLFIEDLQTPEVQKYLVEADSGILCRMIAVPKDSRGPRLICVHPKEAIWIQQGQRRWLEGLICSHPSTRDAIKFTSQLENGERALLSSSILGGFATLDMKEASDRISHKLFKYLFGGFEDILGCARADHVQLMDNRVVELQKYAPMGNCLTFPVESLIFWALCTAAICVDARQKQSDANVYVFGDDIQYPPKFHDVVIARLASCGLVPNEAKTFVNGSFKESCGVDALLGFNVTPLRLRSDDPSSVSGAVAFCDMARRAKARGYHRLSAKLLDYVRQWRFVGFSNDPNCSGLVEYVPNVPVWELATWTAPGDIRFNRRYHRWESRCLLPKVAIKRPLNTRWCVVDSLWRIERSSSISCYSLARVGRGEEEYDSMIRRMRHQMVADYSVSGLTYPDPDRIRLTNGWTPLL